MSETEKTPERQTGSGNSPDKPKGPLPKKPFRPRFTVYWVWGIIVVGLILIEVIGNINWSEKEIAFPYFKENLLAPHYVSRVVVVNNDVAEIYLKPEALSLPQFNKEFGQKGTANGPQYYIKILSGDSFMSNLNEAQKDYPDTEKIYPEKASKYDWGDILTYLFPIAL